MKKAENKERNFFPDFMLSCSVEIISLTPRFNAVNLERAQAKPFKRFFYAHTFRTRLKPGVNEKFSTKQCFPY
jgi:hypothetical protein